MSTISNIQQTPEYTLNKQLVVDSLMKNLEISYKNIQSFSDMHTAVKTEINSILQSYTPDNNLEIKIKLLEDNIERFIPDLSISVDNTYIESIKQLVKDTNLLNYDCLFTNLLDITDEASLDNLTEIPSSFVDILCGSSVGAVANNILAAFPTKDFSIGIDLSLLKTNYNIFNISDDVSGLLSNVSKLVTDFSDVIDVSKIKNIFNDATSLLSNLNITALGNLDVDSMLSNAVENLGLSNILDSSKLDSIKNISKTLQVGNNKLLSDVKKISNVVGCVSAVGSMPNSILGSSASTLSNGQLSTLTNLNNSASGFSSKLVDGAGELVTNLSDSFMSCADLIPGSELFSGMASFVSDGISGVQGIMDTIGQPLSSLADFANSTLSEITGVFGEATDGLLNMFEGGFEGFNNLANMVNDNLSVFNELDTFISDLPNQFTNVSDFLTTGFTDILPTTVGYVGDTIATIDSDINEIKDGLSSFMLA